MQGDPIVKLQHRVDLARLVLHAAVRALDEAIAARDDHRDTLAQGPTPVVPHQQFGQGSSSGIGQ
jgi:hypothetical protein